MKNKLVSLLLVFLLFVGMLLVFVPPIGCSRQYSDTEYESPLTKDEAYMLASFGSSVLPFYTYVVQPGNTGSMAEIFDHNVYLTVSDLWDRRAVGQIVIFEKPGQGQIVHQTFKINSRGNLYTRAINSRGRGWDLFEITENEYVGTVVNITQWKKND